MFFPSKFKYGILSDLQKLLRYFDRTVIIAFFSIPFVWFGTDLVTVFLNKLALYVNDLKSFSTSISALTLVASSLEKYHKLPALSE